MQCVKVDIYADDICDEWLYYDQKASMRSIKANPHKYARDGAQLISMMSICKVWADMVPTLEAKAVMAGSSTVQK